MVNIIEEPGESDREQTLEQCEVALYHALRHELEAAAVVGMQLAKIRANELFRAARCDSFEVYCRQFLEMNLVEVRRFADIAEVINTIRATNLELPESETQVLLLSKIPKDRLIVCWKTVLAHCAKEETISSNGLIRRALKFELAREKSSRKSVSPREGVAGERTEEASRNGEEGDGVKVDLEL